MSLTQRTQNQRTQNIVTRREMLATIRQHLAASAAFDNLRQEHETTREPRTHAGSVAAVVPASGAVMIERFRDSLEGVAGHCIVVRDETEAAAVVQQIIEQMNSHHIAVSNAPLVRSVMQHVESDSEVLERFSVPELFNCDIGVTSAQWAAAETGTLVMESEQETHRLVSLVPRVHIAIIRAEQICLTLGEVLQSFTEQGRDGLSRAVTFITGPSRTSDIELTLVIGVHGPVELYVIIIEAEDHE